MLQQDFTNTKSLTALDFSFNISIVYECHEMFGVN